MDGDVNKSSWESRPIPWNTYGGAEIALDGHTMLYATKPNAAQTYFSVGVHEAGTVMWVKNFTHDQEDHLMERYVPADVEREWWRVADDPAAELANIAKVKAEKEAELAERMASRAPHDGWDQSIFDNLPEVTPGA